MVMPERRTWSIAVNFARQTDGRVTFSSFHWSPPRECWPNDVIATVEELRTRMAVPVKRGQVTDAHDRADLKSDAAYEGAVRLTSAIAASVPGPDLKRCSSCGTPKAECDRLNGTCCVDCCDGPTHSQSDGGES